MQYHTNVYEIKYLFKSLKIANNVLVDISRCYYLEFVLY